MAAAIPEFTGPTSEVIGAGDDWQNRALLVPHEPIRLMLLEMERVLRPEYFSGADEWKVAAFFKWYDHWFFPFVHHHHATEEDIYFPLVAARADNIPERMSADHVALLRQLDEVKGMRGEFSSAQGTEARAALAQKLRSRVADMAAEMREHLTEEERFFTPVIRAKFSEKEHAAIVDRIIKSMGLGGARISLPWIQYAMHRWGGPEVVKVVRAGFPLPIRLALDWFWYPAFLKSLAAFRSLDQSAPPVKAGRQSKKAAVQRQASTPKPVRAQ